MRIGKASIGLRVVSTLAVRSTGVLGLATSKTFRLAGAVAIDEI